MKKSNFYQIYLYLLIFIFIFISKFSYAELLKPSPLLKPEQVIAIQLKALNNNDNPYKNFGIEQTWEFAHPDNRKFTGPLENFTRMMFSSSYKNMINHNKHKINLIQKQIDTVSCIVFYNSHNLSNLFKDFWMLGA